MKSKEELNAIKEEVETLNKKLKELTEDELKAVIGGFVDVSECPDFETCTADPAKCYIHIGTRYGACIFCPRF